MSATIQKEYYVEDLGTIVKTWDAGDFVVCNLSSINLGRAVPANALERLIPIQVRMLDNVIDLNNLPVMQAQVTNKKYRAIGLGTFGWHHLLALKDIAWESDDAVKYADTLYDEIAYLTIKASNDIAKEKGEYPYFEGSDWQTGEYFTKHGYDGDKKWDELKREVTEHGIRNGYLMAVAPNGSTSVIAGSTATIDPVFKNFFHEEKKEYKLPVVAPDMNYKTYKHYEKTAHQQDQFASIRQNKERSRHIDQGISFNIYVPNTISAKVLLNLHLEVWKAKIKTSYYVRSTALVVTECSWCSS